MAEKSLKWLITLFFKSRLKTASPYDLTDGVERLVKSDTGLSLDEIRNFAPTMPVPRESTTKFVERVMKEKELAAKGPKK